MKPAYLRAFLLWAMRGKFNFSEENNIGLPEFRNA